MRFIQKRATGWTDAVAEASSLMTSKGTVSLALDTPDDMWCLKETIVEDDKLIFGDSSSSSTSEQGASGKTLLVRDTDFDATTSTLHVTGTLEKSAVTYSRTKKDLLDDAPQPTRRVSISPESVITLHRDGGFSLSERQRILDAARPDRRSEVLAIVVLDKNFSSANVRILSGEEQRYDESVKVDVSLLTDGDRDGSSEVAAPSTAKKTGKGERKSQTENKRKETKQARSTKGMLAPLQGTLFELAVNSLMNNLDLEHCDPCPLLIASLGEAAHNFQTFVRTYATSHQNKALLQMVNDAIVVDTFGAAGQGAVKFEADQDAKATKQTDKKGKKFASKKTKDSTVSTDTTTNSNGSNAKNKDNIWLPAYRQNINKKNMGPFDEMMMRADVLTKIHNVRFDSDLSLVRDVQERVRYADTDSEQGARAAYGVKSVEKAIQEGAVGAGGVLLVNKSLFHNGKFQETVASLSNTVREGGGEVRVISDSHDSGQRLSKLGDIAANLTFPLFGLDELEDEQGKKEKE